MTPFFGIEIRKFLELREQKISGEINDLKKEYILNVNEQEYIDYIVDKYSLILLNIDLDSERVNQPRRQFTHNVQGNVHAYTFDIDYNYSGSADLFKVKPDNYNYMNFDIDANIDESKSIVSFSFEFTGIDPSKFHWRKEASLQTILKNLTNVNRAIEQWNNNLTERTTKHFQELKEKYQNENKFFAAIKVNVDKNTTYLFTAPTVRKKNISQPATAKGKTFSSEPTMDGGMYEDVLRVIYDSGKSMERKPAMYKGKNEEGLRDQFLFVLETRYEGTTATGETFNREGKADIILKYAEDGSNLFVAECKFWDGESKFLGGISQLFDRYLTWHDSKVALLVFVKAKGFSAILETIKNEIKNHKYYVKDVGARFETSFSYLFRLPQDKEKVVHFEVLAFHYDKN